MLHSFLTRRKSGLSSRASMGARLSELVREHYLDPAAFGRDPSPVLLWLDPPPPKERPDLLWVTQGNHRVDAGSAEPADPEIFRIAKHPTRANAFALGITLGRTSNNDIQLDDPSVSRFHAYFQQDPHSGVWHVVDAESSNGTLIAGVRLQPKRPAPLADRTEIKFGHVNVQFLSVAAFVATLDERVKPAALGPKRK
jgi:hypothetical protein